MHAFYDHPPEPETFSMPPLQGERKCLGNGYLCEEGTRVLFGTYVKSWWCFLYTDMLVFTLPSSSYGPDQRPRKDAIFAVKEVVSLVNVRVVTDHSAIVEYSDFPLENSFLLTTPSKTYRLGAHDKTNREIWITNIEVTNQMLKRRNRLSDEQNGDVDKVLSADEELAVAVKSADVKKVQELIKNLNGSHMGVYVDDQGLSALHYALELGNLQIVTNLVEDGGAKVNLKYLCTTSPLSAAIDAAKVFGSNLDNCVHILLKAKADVNFPSDTVSDGRLVPLHHAARMGAYSVILELLSAGADPNVFDDRGLCLLHTIDASKKFNGVTGADVIKKAVSVGADLHKPNVNDLLPLHCAAKTGREVTAELLLMLNADVNDRTDSSEGQSALHIAVQKDNYDVVIVLLRYGAEPNMRDQSALACCSIGLDFGQGDLGDTPLHFVRGQSVANLLVSHGSRMELVRRDGRVVDPVLDMDQLEEYTKHFEKLDLMLDEPLDGCPRSKWEHQTSTCGLCRCVFYTLLRFRYRCATCGIQCCTKCCSKETLVRQENDRNARKRRICDPCFNRYFYGTDKALIETKIKKSRLHRDEGKLQAERQERFSYPEDCLDPISLSVMEDPVILCDGHSYERASIRQWLEHHITSPQTNVKLKDFTLIPNVELKAKIASLTTQRTFTACSSQLEYDTESALSDETTFSEML